VFLESPRGDFVSDDLDETKNYLEAFQRITETSLEPSDSVRLIRLVARELA
jgi:hypothetical protein